MPPLLRACHLALLALVALAACDDDPTSSVEDLPVSSISLTYRSVAVTVGDTFNVGVQVNGGTGAPVDTRRLEWRSLAPSVADVWPGDVSLSAVDDDAFSGTTQGAAIVGRVAGATRVVVRGGLQADTIDVTVFGTSPSGTPFLARSLASGGNGHHACAIAVDDMTYCWGDNSRGQLGDGSGAHRGGATPVAGGERFASLALGESHSCGLTAQGAVHCWGAAEAVGHADTAHGRAVRPGRVTLPEPITQLDAYAATTCGLTAAGAAYCWGATPVVGTSPPESRTVGPAAVPTALRFTALAVGGLSNCALTAEGAAYCSGARLPGFPPEQTNDGVAEPVALAPGTRFTDLAMIGFGYGIPAWACGTTIHGDTRCWAPVVDYPPDSGQRILIDSGYALTGLSGGAHTVGSSSVSSVALRRLCGVTTAREARCWSAETFDLSNAYPPMETVAGVGDVAQLAVGARHACARTGGGQVLCWGSNSYGQLGDGTLIPHAVAQSVRAP